MAGDYPHCLLGCLWAVKKKGKGGKKRAVPGMTRQSAPSLSPRFRLRSRHERQGGGKKKKREKGGTPPSVVESYRKNGASPVSMSLIFSRLVTRSRSKKKKRRTGVLELRMRERRGGNRSGPAIFHLSAYLARRRERRERKKKRGKK